MAVDPKKNIEVRQRRYVGRDFDSFRSLILSYARTYYPDKIQDFSESSVGGLFMDMASYVGDNLSFYLDHLYGELNYETAVETESIQRALINAGIPINGASPSVVRVTVFIEVPVENAGDSTPDVNLLPVIKESTTFLSDSGITFTLIEDIPFAYDENNNGNYVLHPKAEKRIGRVRFDGKVTTYLVALSGLCISGAQTEETYTISDFVPFRRITLNQSNVTEVVKVFDTYGNVYYEVGALTHDVVYKNVLNS